MSVLEQIKADFADGNIPYGLAFGYKNGVKIGDNYVSITVSSKFRKFRGVYHTKFICTLFENSLTLGVYTKSCGVKNYQKMFTFSKSKHGKILIRKPKSLHIQNNIFYRTNQLHVVPNHLNLCKVFKYFFSKHGLKFKIYNKKHTFHEFFAINNSSFLQLLYKLLKTNPNIPNLNANPNFFKKLNKISTQEDLVKVLKIPDLTTLVNCYAPRNAEINIIFLRYLFKDIPYEEFASKWLKGVNFRVYQILFNLDFVDRLLISNKTNLLKNFKDICENGFSRYHFLKKSRKIAREESLQTAANIILFMENKNVYLQTKFPYLRQFKKIHSLVGSLIDNIHEQPSH